MAFNRLITCPGVGLPPASEAPLRGWQLLARGYCSACGRDYAVRGDGMMPRHRTASDNV